MRLRWMRYTVLALPVFGSGAAVIVGLARLNWPKPQILARWPDRFLHRCRCGSSTHPDGNFRTRSETRSGPVDQRGQRAIFADFLSDRDCARMQCSMGSNRCSGLRGDRFLAKAASATRKNPALVDSIFRCDLGEGKGRHRNVLGDAQYTVGAAR